MFQQGGSNDLYTEFHHSTKKKVWKCPTLGKAINLEKANDKNTLKQTPPEMPKFGGRLLINALTDDKLILVG